jgi:exosortase/archaeosortase family protein
MTGRRTGHRERAHRAADATERSWVIGFVVRLLIGWALAIVALSLLPGIDRTAVAGTVWSVNAALRAIAFHPEITGATIRLGGAALQIIPECTPVMPVLLLAIAMFAYPAPGRWKLAGVAAGIAALWIYNVIRMLALIATLAVRPAWFQFMHVYLWQSVTLLVVCALFLAWLKYAPPAPARP